MRKLNRREVIKGAAGAAVAVPAVAGAAELDGHISKNYAEEKHPGCQLKIVMTGHGRGKVYIDGWEVPYCRGISFNARADEANTAFIEILPSETEIEGIANITNMESIAKEFAQNGTR